VVRRVDLRHGELTASSIRGPDEPRSETRMYRGQSSTAPPPASNRSGLQSRELLAVGEAGVDFASTSRVRVRSNAVYFPAVDSMANSASGGEHDI
jgi:hypothetical protein